MASTSPSPFSGVRARALEVLVEREDGMPYPGADLGFQGVDREAHGYRASARDHRGDFVAFASGLPSPELAGKVAAYCTRMRLETAAQLLAHLDAVARHHPRFAGERGRPCEAARIATATETEAAVAPAPTDPSLLANSDPDPGIQTDGFGRADDANAPANTRGDPLGSRVDRPSCDVATLSDDVHMSVGDDGERAGDAGRPEDEAATLPSPSDLSLVPVCEMEERPGRGICAVMPSADRFHHAASDVAEWEEEEAGDGAEVVNMLLELDTDNESTAAGYPDFARSEREWIAHGSEDGEGRAGSVVMPRHSAESAPYAWASALGIPAHATDDDAVAHARRMREIYRSELRAMGVVV